jgi:hypothetical protein
VVALISVVVPVTDTPTDPVLKFITDRTVRELVIQGSDRWPYSRLSASRVSKIGYQLIVLRCAQLGVEPPTRAEAAEWSR